MIWPFKKQKVISMEEYVSDKPMPPCGEKITHYHWTDFEGWKCPICAKDEEKAREEERENRMARKIAEQVVAMQKDKP